VLFQLNNSSINFSIYFDFNFFYKKLVFFKKNNSNFKKLNNSFNKYNNNNIEVFQNLYINAKKKNIENKYFFFFYRQNVNELLPNSNTKLTDLKKKFTTNLINFKSLFNSILNLKQFKKKSLFKFYNNFIFFFNKNKFFFEYSFVHILFKLKYIFNFSDYLYLKKNNFIFFNRVHCSLINSNFVLNKGDIIELLFSNLYFFYLKKINFFSSKLNFKFYKNNTKLKSNFFLFFNIFNKSLNLENSFKTNSIIVINKVNNYSLISNYLNFYLNFYLIRLYK
jgi:hypothetical protein